MARRPLSFGVRLRDRERDQTLVIRAESQASEGYVVEHTGRDIASTHRRHETAADAVRDGARAWRHRLH